MQRHLHFFENQRGTPHTYYSQHVGSRRNILGDNLYLLQRRHRPHFYEYPRHKQRSDFRRRESLWYSIRQVEVKEVVDSVAAVAAHLCRKWYQIRKGRRLLCYFHLQHMQRTSHSKRVDLDHKLTLILAHRSQSRLSSRLAGLVASLSRTQELSWDP